MPEWIQPEFHEIEQEEITEMLNTKPIHDTEKDQKESALKIACGVICMVIGIVALAILFLTY